MGEEIAESDDGILSWHKGQIGDWGHICSGDLGNDPAAVTSFPSSTPEKIALLVIIIVTTASYHIQYERWHLSKMYR